MSRPRPQIVLGSLLLAALFVRVWGIWRYYYNPDEMEFLIIAKADTLAEVWRRGLAELHPPLAQLIRHYVVMLTDDPLAQRFTSIAPGLVAVLGLYRFGVVLRGRRLGLVLAAVATFSPLAVSTSTTIRNYAFFTAFLFWALASFVRYQERGATRDLVSFSVLMVLACASHFGGFLVAFVCGVHEGTRLAIARRWTTLTRFAAAFVPLVLLGSLLALHYLAPGTSIPTWHRVMTSAGFIAPDSAGRARTAAAGFVAVFIPFVTFFGRVPLAIQALMLAGAVVLLGLHVVGLVRMFRVAPRVAALVLTASAVGLAASFTYVYPFGPTRHNACWFPFLLLPLAYLFEPLVDRVGWLSIALLVPLSLGLVSTGIYAHYGEEFALRRHDFDDGQQWLQSRLRPGDAIVTGRVAAYFYFVYARDAGRTPYDGYGPVPYVNGSTVLAPFDPPSRPAVDWRAFHDDLALQLADGANGNANVWFVMYAWRNTEIWHLMECDPIRARIENFMTRDGVVIFSIPRRELATFLRQTRDWESCYADYRPVIFASAFEAYPWKSPTGSP